MPPRYPLPVPAGVNVAQAGTAALWNGTMPPTANFLLNRPYAFLYQTVAQTIPGSAGGPSVPIALDAGVDNYGGHSTIVNNSRYVCQLAGLYHIIGQLGMQTPAIVGSAEQQSGLTITVTSSNGGSGTPEPYGASVPLRFDTGPAKAGGTVQASTYIQMRLGDYVELYASPYFNPITTWTGYRASTMFIHWVST